MPAVSRKTRRGAYCAALLLLAVTPLPAASVDGRVVAVSDGQTIVALVDNRRVAVRIAGISAPTGAERHAIASRQSLIALCGGEPARIDTQGARPQDGEPARVACNGVDAASEQVRSGMATVDPRSGARDATLLRLEAGARAARRGVWSGAASAR